MITAALPTYNNATALPIQLEALCEQKDAPEWELIVCEEQSADYFGRDNLRQYVQRLKAANCVRISYIELSEWAPLGEKWLMIRDRMHPDSVGMMLCASDNHSPQDRVRVSYDAMTAGHDWAQFNSGHFYDVRKHKAGLFSVNERNPGLFMCIAAEPLKAFSAELYPKRGVDTWLFKGIAPKNPLFMEYTDGVHTDGVNTISLRRHTQYTGANASGFFKKADADEIFNKFGPKAAEYIKTLRL